MKIRTAVFGVYVTASAVGFAVVVLLVSRDVHRRYLESMRRTLGDTATFLATFVAQEPDAPAGWPQRLAALPHTDRLRVFACDREGRVVFDAARGRDVGRVYRWPMTGGGRAASEDYSVRNVAEVEGELRVAAPVRHGPELVGWVGVGRPLVTVAEGVSRARWELFTSLGTVAAVMVAAGWWIATRLTQSVERLTEYATAVRDGLRATPPRSRAAEVAAVARALEEMRVALEGKAYVERYTQALAHEIKAPLSAMRGAAELLAENPPEADRARFLANLRAECDRLQRIVERLLELAALESRRAAAVEAEVELGPLLQERLEASRTVAAARRVTVELAASSDVRVRGDRFLLDQAIGNLVHNAIDFSPVGGVVSIALCVAGERVSVVVEDNGPGVPDYALEKIFDRFYSLPRPDSGRKSSGLGLSIVREIARLHEGEIRLSNRLEGGARAVLSLPIAREFARSSH